MTQSSPDRGADRGPQRSAPTSGDTNMRWMYVGVVLVEITTLLALWSFQQYFTL